MTHIILCDTFRNACVIANEFANHYTESKDMQVIKRQTEVTVGDNKFIFINRNDPRSVKGIRGDFISYKDFIKKYFGTPK